MRKQKLIDAIKETIIDLETGRKKFLWTDFSSCNCGLLAQNICGISKEDLDNIPAPSGIWGNDAVCAMTGSALDEVFQKMYSAGMLKSDILNLENLSDEEVLKEVGRKLPAGWDETPAFTIKENVLAYFQAWLRILERETPSEPKEEPKGVTMTFEKLQSVQPIFQS